MAILIIHYIIVDNKNCQLIKFIYFWFLFGVCTNVIVTLMNSQRNNDFISNINFPLHSDRSSPSPIQRSPLLTSQNKLCCFALLKPFIVFSFIGSFELDSSKSFSCVFRSSKQTT